MVGSWLLEAIFAAGILPQYLNISMSPGSCGHLGVRCKRTEDFKYECGLRGSCRLKGPQMRVRCKTEGARIILCPMR